MSVEQFKKAKKDLMFSQQLMDMTMPPQMPQEQGMPQEAPEMPQDEPMVEEPMMEHEEAVEAPEAPEDQTKGIVEGVIEGLKEFFTKKDEEPKEVEVKIEGEMVPKKEE